MSGLTCYRCGNRGHTMAKCKMSKNIVCHKCGKTGHIWKACRSQQGKGRTQNKSSQCRAGKVKSETVRQVEAGEESDSTRSSDSDIHVSQIVCATRSVTSSPPISVRVEVDSRPLTMEVDTGESHTLMSEKLFQQMWPRRSLLPSPIRLGSYTKQPIVVRGCCNVNVHYRSQSRVMPLLIVQGDGPTLLGRDWLS